MKKSVLITCIAAIALLIGFIVSIPLINNLTAAQVMNELNALSLPERTEQVESIYKAGKLVGNGNGMQYFGAILIKSELSINELNAHFSAQGDYTVKAQSAQEIDIIEHESLCFESEVSSENYYIVYAWGNGIGLYEALDLRGH